MPLRRATRGRRAIDAPVDPDAEVIPPAVNQATPERQAEINAYVAQKVKRNTEYLQLQDLRQLKLKLASDQLSRR